MHLNNRIVLLGLASLFAALLSVSYSGLADQRLLAPASVVIAAAALLAAWQSLRKLRSLETRFTNMARTLEGVLRQMQTSTDRAATTIGDLDQAMKAEVAALQMRIAGRAPVAAAPAAMEPAVQNRANPNRGNVVRMPTAASRADPEMDMALDAGVLPVSLQPIVSLSRSSAEAFSVFACLRDGEGYRHVEAGSARFEEILALSAIAARRRQMPGLASGVSIHVPVTSALLDSAEAAARVIDAYRLQPELANEVWLQVPAEWFDDSRSAGIRSRFLAAGVRFVAAGWSQSANCSHLKSLGVSAIRLPASFLLDHGQPRHSGKVARMLADAAASGIQVIAAGVSTDEEAVALVDLGVDLMSGDRFSGPQRLRGETVKTRIA